MKLSELRRQLREAAKAVAAWTCTCNADEDIVPHTDDCLAVYNDWENLTKPANLIRLLDALAEKDEALEFYCDPTAWVADAISPVCAIIKDRGKQARKALEGGDDGKRAAAWRKKAQA